MSEESGSTERQANLWAPWRMEYIASLGDDDDGCFLCRYRDDEAHDEPNLVLWRARRCFAVMNRFPYTGGHMLISPLDHVADLADLDVEVLGEMMGLLRDAQRVLQHVVRAQGFNIGMNVGRCAGAGLPGHLHMHLVPRWQGDTNFMAVFGQVRVIPETLAALYGRLREGGAALNLPNLRP